LSEKLMSEKMIPEKLIQVRQLSYNYRTGTEEQVGALRGIDLEVFRGEFLVITGENGSGKSTLARHFNGLLHPASGEVLVDGLSVKDKKQIKKIRQKVGMVFQNPDNQIVSTVVEDDVAFGPENLGVPREEILRRVEETLKAVNMYHLRQESPSQLSDGEKQLVAIAGVMAMQPECVVLDEPTAHLDPRGRQELMENVKRLNREKGVTVIFITHFMKEAVEADRMVVMSEGEIKLKGPPREVFHRFQEISEVGMNKPVPMEMASRLRQKGVQLSENILHTEELVEEICRLK